MEHPKERLFPKESIPGNTHTLRYSNLEVDVYRLIHATREVPTTKVPIDTLLKELEEECWTDVKGNRVTPRTVVKNNKRRRLRKSIT